MVVLLELPLVASCILALVQSIGPICLWGRMDDSHYSSFNGLYTYYHHYNGKPSYIKTEHSSCLGNIYLWSVPSGDQWRVSDTIGLNSSSNINAYCNINSTDPSSCTIGNWNIAGFPDTSSYESDPNLYAQAEFCPFWDCASISTNYPNNAGSCYGPFDVQIAPNVWQKNQSINGNGDEWWVFNVVLFQWLCTSTSIYRYARCSGNGISGETVSGWTDLSSGSSVSLQFEGFGAYSVSCTGIGHPSPTSAPNIPMASPTSSPIPFPTGSPVTAPSSSPTISPSAAPTLFPSSAPSYFPTTSPSVAPTLIPSSAPTSPPSVAPSYSPTLPSSAPSGFPTLSPMLTPTNEPTTVHINGSNRWKMQIYYVVMVLIFVFIL